MAMPYERQPQQPVAKIREFLKQHQDAHIIVCTGYASVSGLAWLARNVNPIQRVTLVIGDMTANNFNRATDTDRAAAAGFLRSSNVRVHNWYRTKPVKKIAHGKAFVAQRGGRTEAVLVGSANLTETGLIKNLEMMVRCHPDDWREIEAYFAEATRHPAVNAKLISFVAPPETAKVLTSHSSTDTRKSGCLSATALIPLQILKSLWSKLTLTPTRGWK